MLYRWIGGASVLSGVEHIVDDDGSFAAAVVRPGVDHTCCWPIERRQRLRGRLNHVHIRYHFHSCPGSWSPWPPASGIGPHLENLLLSPAIPPTGWNAVFHRPNSRGMRPASRCRMWWTRRQGIDIVTIPA